MNIQESSTLNILRFLMAVCVVFLHAHTSTQMYPLLQEHYGYQLTARFLSLQWGDIAVPCFYLISGFLFFNRYTQTLSCYRSKLQTRVYTLLIPYLFWSFFIIILYYAVESIPAIRSLFNNDHKLIHDFKLPDFFKAIWAMDNGGLPLLTQLWFVRNLMLLVIASPLIYIVVRYTRLVGIAILGIVWSLHTIQLKPPAAYSFSLSEHGSASTAIV